MSIEQRGRPGRYLRYARRKAGLTQVELAERAGVPQSVIARIESGSSVPRFDTIDRLLHACGFALELAPRAGAGVDRTLIEPLVEATPTERAVAAVEQASGVADLMAAASR
jgi:transcriptional regulator with XRE-family HTH domain